MHRRLLLAATAALFVAPAFALDDAQPDAALAAVQGEWLGSLTYRDYQQPDRLVTLPTRLFVALAARDELALHYVFDDGPGKTVHSYEKMRFDFAAGTLGWTSGTSDKLETRPARIVSSTQSGEVRRVVFERDAEHGKDRYTLDLAAQALGLKKEEIDGRGTARLRNKYEFRRVAP